MGIQDKQTVLAQMDAAADQARDEFMQQVILGAGTAKTLARWFAKYKNSAGYTRLGYIILDYAKNTQ